MTSAPVNAGALMLFVLLSMYCTCSAHVSYCHPYDRERYDGGCNDCNNDSDLVPVMGVAANIGSNKNEISYSGSICSFIVLAPMIYMAQSQTMQDASTNVASSIDSVLHLFKPRAQNLSLLNRQALTTKA